jgi:hypothetical protein
LARATTRIACSKFTITIILIEAINDMVAADKNYIWVAWGRSDSESFFSLCSRYCK